MFKEQFNKFLIKSCESYPENHAPFRDGNKCRLEKIANGKCCFLKTNFSKSGLKKKECKKDTMMKKKKNKATELTNLNPSYC